MAQVGIVALIAKAAVGMVVSKVVGKITGSELLGALAGGFVGAGFQFNPTTGAMSWSNPVEGLFGASSSAASGVASVGVDPASLIGDVSSGASDFGLGAITNSADVAGANLMGSAVTDTVASGTGSGIANMGSQALMGAAAPTAASATQAPGMLTKATDWMEKNPGLTKIGGDLISGALSPDKIDQIEAKGDQDRLTLIEKQKQELAAKQAVDPNALAGRLDAINQNLFTGGYRNSAFQSALSGFTPGYSTMTSPNYDSRVNAVYKIPSKEQKVVE